jgi:hypothetical protein
MLPSGNDAALTLATAFGKYIHFANINERRKIVTKELKDSLKMALQKHFALPFDKYHQASSQSDNELYIAAFVSEMNRYAR